MGKPKYIYWEGDLCGCCKVTECGCFCCLSNLLCADCIWGSAMEAAKVGICPVCCIGMSCCGPCTHCQGRALVAEKYNIEEGPLTSCCIACCCPICSYFQVVDHILIKEGKTWGMGVVVDKTKGGGPPLMGKTMDR